MKPTPIHLIVSRLKRLPLHHQIAHLRALVELERPHSIRCGELQSLLQAKVERQLCRENKQDKRA